MYVKLGSSRCCICSVVEAPGEESMSWVPRHVISYFSIHVPLIERIFVLYLIIDYSCSSAVLRAVFQIKAAE